MMCSVKNDVSGLSVPQHLPPTPAAGREAQICSRASPEELALDAYLIFDPEEWHLGDSELGEKSCFLVCVCEKEIRGHLSELTPLFLSRRRWKKRIKIQPTPFQVSCKQKSYRMCCFAFVQHSLPMHVGEWTAAGNSFPEMTAGYRKQPATRW